MLTEDDLCAEWVFLVTLCLSTTLSTKAAGASTSHGGFFDRFAQAEG